MSLLRPISRLTATMGMFCSRPVQNNFSGRSGGQDFDDLVAKARSNPRQMTQQEWKEILGPKTYEVARNKGTERPFTSPLYDNHKKGMYKCACCEADLFSSEHKFDSGTGWPSFYETSAPDNVTKHSDRSFGMIRTEVLCKNCDAHLGHVFNDGPAPTGLRYCINGVTLKFFPEQK